MISDYHKFIYTKIGKTASTSIEYALRHKVKDIPRRLGHYHLIDDLTDDTKNYFKFTFVRNPWERCVSFYHFTRDVQCTEREAAYNDTSFEDFLRSPDPPACNPFTMNADWCKHSPTLQRLYENSHPLENQIDWITDSNSKLLTNFVGKVEDIQKDYDIICNILRIRSEPLTRANPSRHGHYSEYYNRETRDIVAKRYARDIEAFNYSY